MRIFQKTQIRFSAPMMVTHPLEFLTSFPGLNGSLHTRAHTHRETCTSVKAKINVLIKISRAGDI